MLKRQYVNMIMTVLNHLKTIFRNIGKITVLISLILQSQSKIHRHKSRWKKPSSFAHIALIALLTLHAHSQSNPSPIQPTTRYSPSVGSHGGVHQSAAAANPTSPNSGTILPPHTSNHPPSTACWVYASSLFTCICANGDLFGRSDPSDHAAVLRQDG
jgi:hypothetical protein